MLLQLESVVLFVNDIDAAAAWYAELLGVPVAHENPRYAFVRTSHGVNIGFHPADTKNPGGVPGTTPYWEVVDFDAALATLLARGATLHRGPAVTDFGARVALLIDPFGNTLGLNQRSR
jgi:predicted enzyme related to lactoylglutathione lyase